MKLINAEVKAICECGEQIIGDWVGLDEKTAKREALIYFNNLKHLHENSSKHKEFMLEKEKYEIEVNKFIKEK